MTKKDNNTILRASETYIDAVSTIENDLCFWQAFLKSSITEYLNKSSETKELHSSIFTVYNINPITNKGLLKAHSNVHSLRVDNLERNRVDFFSWIMNFSIIKFYNAMEILLLQAIQIEYFPNGVNPIKNKKAMMQIQQEIVDCLKANGIKVDMKNNKYIIQFLKIQSPEINLFLNNTIRIDLTTNWEHFFELTSILRNMIAHHGMIVSQDSHNEIKSKSNDIFQRHFNLTKNGSDYLILAPKEKEFSNFLLIINDFVLNLVRLVFKRQDMSIFQMH